LQRPRQRLLKNCVECRAEKRIEAALEFEKSEESFVQKF